MKDSRLSNAAKEDPFSFLDGFGRPLLIDEVQAAPYLFNDVKVILDENELGTIEHGKEKIISFQAHKNGN